LETGALPVELRPCARTIVLARLYSPDVAAPSQRNALGALFFVLALAFGGVAYAAAVGGQGGARWVIAAAAGVLAFWLAGLAVRALRRR
jgi:hypothetical protein